MRSEKLTIQNEVVLTIKHQYNSGSKFVPSIHTDPNNSEIQIDPRHLETDII